MSLNLRPFWRQISTIGTCSGCVYNFTFANVSVLQRQRAAGTNNASGMVVASYLLSKVYVDNGPLLFFTQLENQVMTTRESYIAAVGTKRKRRQHHFPVVCKPLPQPPTPTLTTSCVMVCTTRTYM